MCYKGLEVVKKYAEKALLDISYLLNLKLTTSLTPVKRTDYTKQHTTVNETKHVMKVIGTRVSYIKINSGFI